MSWIDWLILVLPICFVMYMGYYSRKYIRGVSDYLAAGRVCGRYVLNMSGVANGLSIIGLAAYIEQYYKTGGATGFWGRILVPLSVVIALSGYCSYRFRETKAMSLGQFLEMRYSRKLRIFAAGLRSLAEMLANMIMPAVAARFFIQMMDLPNNINILGLSLPTFDVLIILFLVLAIALICMGGTLALVITDTIQGFIIYPLTIMLVVFMLSKFSISNQVLPVLVDRAPGESFINPFDVEKLRDFNFFSAVIVAAFEVIMHGASWIGAGTSSAARTPHEQKMAGLIGTWGGAIISIIYIILGTCLVTFLNHKDFANDANIVRKTLANRVIEHVIVDENTRASLKDTVSQIPPQIHTIGVDKPLSQEENLDSEFLDKMHQTLTADAKSHAADDKNAQIDAEGKANNLFQQCRTLYYQLSLSATMRHLLPTGLFGAFCLLLFMAMLSTDDTRIYSATLTIAQDVILPFKKGGFTPENHVRMIRIVAICIGVFFAIGSHFMSQLDYISLYVALACSMWLNGCGPIMIFGLYSKFGTTAGAWASLLSGMVASVGYITIQRNWADFVYPIIAKAGLVDFFDKVLRMLSRPFNPYIIWKMDAVKCPVNTYEFNFFAMVTTLLIYVIVSKLTCKEEFNLDRMLHRGKYSEGTAVDVSFKWTPKNIFKNILSITPEYTRGDKIIAYGYFTYIFVYSFIIYFLGTLILRCFTDLTINYWKVWFWISSIYVTCIVTAIATVWLGACGVKDMIQMFKDLKNRVANPLDDGRVEDKVTEPAPSEAKEDENK